MSKKGDTLYSVWKKAISTYKNIRYVSSWYGNPETYVLTMPQEPKGSPTYTTYHDTLEDALRYQNYFHEQYEAERLAKESEKEELIIERLY